MAAGFKPLSMSLLLDSMATLPGSTRVLTGRVAGISSKSDMDNGLNPRCHPISTECQSLPESMVFALHMPHTLIYVSHII
jgi:hypothetical protein